MRKQLMTAAAVLLLSAAGAFAQTSRPLPDDEQSSLQSSTFDPALAGTWQSAPDQMKLTSDFEKSVWGADASSFRSVELEVRPTGEATLKVIKKIVDAEGDTVPASTWIEEAHLLIGEARDGIATRVEHDVKVASAVRLFPDDPDYRWTLDGLRVQIVTFKDGDGDTLEVRYDTPEGRGSFWETLRREGGPTARRAAR